MTSSLLCKTTLSLKNTCMTFIVKRVAICPAETLVITYLNIGHISNKINSHRHGWEDLESLC